VGVADYGIAYERERLQRVDLDLPVIGLPRSLDGLRIGLITDVHHSRLVSAEAVSRPSRSSPTRRRTSWCWAATT